MLYELPMVFTSDGAALAGTLVRELAELAQLRRPRPGAVGHHAHADCAQRRLRVPRQCEDRARATGGQETARLDRQGRTDRFLRCARIREHRRGPRRRLVRGDVISPDDGRGAVMAVVRYVDTRKWKELQKPLDRHYEKRRNESEKK